MAVRDRIDRADEAGTASMELTKQNMADGGCEAAERGHALRGLCSPPKVADSMVQRVEG